MSSAFPGNRDTGMVRLYAGLMLVAAAATIAFALVATRAAPQYSSSAEVLIDPAITPSGNFIQPSMPTEQRVATSSEVIGAVAEQLGVTSTVVLDQLSVSVPVDTQVLVMTYTSATPASALAGADAIAQTYLKARNPAKVQDAVASVVGTPGLPSEPLTTNYPVVLGVAVVGGLLVGFTVAWAWDRVRGRIRTIADAEQSAELDALAVLPRGSLADAETIATGRPHLDSLAARVLGQIEGGPRPCVLLTGVGLECDSTAAAVQTALALSRMGRVVILVTADHGVVAHLSLDGNPGHGSSGSAGDTWPEYAAAKLPGLHLLPVGEWDVGGVAASKLTHLLPELQDRLPEAVVVIDGPPAWQSAGLALRADRVLLVVGLGRSSRISTAAAVQALDHCREKVMGLVIVPRDGRVARAWAMLRRRKHVTQAVRPAGQRPLATLAPSGLSVPIATPAPAESRAMPVMASPTRPMAPQFRVPSASGARLDVDMPRSGRRPRPGAAPPLVGRTDVLDLEDRVWGVLARGPFDDAGQGRVPRPQPTWSTPT